MAMLIRVDGSMTLVSYDNREDLCRLVDDGALDIVWNRPSKGLAIVCGDFHARYGKVLNEKATELAGEQVHGNAVLLNTREVRWYRKGRCSNRPGVAFDQVSLHRSQVPDILAMGQRGGK